MAAKGGKRGYGLSERDHRLVQATIDAVKGRTPNHLPPMRNEPRGMPGTQGSEAAVAILTGGSAFPVSSPPGGIRPIVFAGSKVINRDIAEPVLTAETAETPGFDAIKIHKLGQYLVGFSLLHATSTHGTGNLTVDSLGQDLCEKIIIETSRWEVYLDKGLPNESVMLGCDTAAWIICGKNVHFYFADSVPYWEAGETGREISLQYTPLMDPKPAGSWGARLWVQWLGDHPDEVDGI